MSTDDWAEFTGSVKAMLTAQSESIRENRHDIATARDECRNQIRGEVQAIEAKHQERDKDTHKSFDELKARIGKLELRVYLAMGAFAAVMWLIEHGGKVPTAIAPIVKP